ncbi:MAG: LPS biosynthesis protein WbpP, partial [Flavobacteriales bacterium]
GATGQIYNVAVGENITINQLYELIASLAGSETKAIHRPSREGDIRDSLADISKAKQLLGYSPTVRAKDGLRMTFEWFSNQKS